MSERSPEFRPAVDEPAVRHPELLRMVEAARAQPPAEVRVDPAAVIEGAARRRRNRRRGAVVGVLAAGLAGLVLASVAPRLSPRSGDEGLARAERHGEPAGPSQPQTPRQAEQPSAGPVSPRAVENPAPPPELGPVLAATIRVTPLDGTATSPQILGTQKLRVSEGRWEIASEAPEAVEVLVPGARLELRRAVLRVAVAGDVARLEVVEGQVVRVDAQGRRETLRPRTEPAAPEARPSAAALARQAERRLVAGDRAGAITALRRLAIRYPRAAEAQAGLIDLGRLLKAAGRPDEARCAYEAFLSRWPGHALGGDVNRAKRALGDGPACKGLRPRRAE